LSPALTETLIEQSIAILRAEVQRLAYASPPPPGRDARVRELQSAIVHLVLRRQGLTGLGEYVVIAGRMLLMLAVSAPLLVGLHTLWRSARGLPPVWAENPHFWAVWPPAGTAVVVVVLGACWWLWYQDRRREQKAIDLAGELTSQPDPR